MTPRALRWTWFVGLWLLLPWPIVAFGAQWVPAVRYAILAGAAGAFALVEGTAGPVGPIVGLLVGWTLGTTLACWGIAWAVSRTLARWPARSAALLTVAVLVVALGWALLLRPYHTYFGRAARSGLLDLFS